MTYASAMARRLSAVAVKVATALVLVIAPVAAQSRAPASPADEVLLTIRVVDHASAPVPRLTVFAVAAGDSAVVARGRTGDDGGVQLRLPPQRCDFGILSPRYLLTGMQQLATGQLRLTVTPAFPDVEPSEVMRDAQRWVAAVVPARGGRTGGRAAIGTIAGTVVDESGVATAGVRILSVDVATEALASVALTDARGRYVLTSVAGPNQLVVYAPGLKVSGAKLARAGQVDITLAVDTAVERITVHEGNVLRFRMSESVWPPYVPPPAVMAFLAARYKIDPQHLICPGDLLKFEPGVSKEWKDQATQGIKCKSPKDCPASVWQRQCKVPSFWWLALLRAEPPDPGAPTYRWWDTIMRGLQAAERDARR